MDCAAEQSRLKLLIGAETGDIDNGVAACRAVCTVASRARRWASHQAAVISPVEANPWPRLPGLVLQVGGLVELFVVVNAEWRPIAPGTVARPLRSAGVKKRAATLEKTISAENPWKFGHADAAGVSGNLGVVPLDRKGDRSGAEHAEVVGVVGVLPDVFAGEDDILSEGLLKAGVEFIAPARAQRV